MMMSQLCWLFVPLWRGERPLGGEVGPPGAMAWDPNNVRWWKHKVGLQNRGVQWDTTEVGILYDRGCGNYSDSSTTVKQEKCRGQHQNLRPQSKNFASIGCPGGGVRELRRDHEEGGNV